MSQRWGWAARILAVATLVLGMLIVPGAASRAYAHDVLPIPDVSGFGDAATYGSTDGVNLAAPVVGMARTSDGAGYWEVAADGGIFTFGDARYYGSMGATRLAAPVTSMAATPDGHGYWLAGADGGIFTFGDAGYYGSMGATRLAAPVTSMAATPDGRGYWLAGADGGIFTFGDARYYGSYGAGIPAVGPTYMRFVGMAATVDGAGYWLVASGFCDSERDATPTSSPQQGPATGLARVSAAHYFSCLDQVQFRFTTAAPGVGYDARYVTNPTAGASGLPVHVAGRDFLQITLHSILAGSYTGPTDIFPGITTNIVEMRETQDFEGYVTWVIGLNQSTSFWVGHAGDDQSLAVDIG